MVGAMVQGTAQLYAIPSLGSGAKSAASVAASIDPKADALVRLVAARVVWWRGWSSGASPV
jgi:hypothetical protein